MHTGDFTITAVVMRWSDMSEYEITGTVTVQLLGIYPTNTVALGASPGSEFELNVITDDQYYWIDWYVKRQGEIGRGNLVDSNPGGTTNLGTMRHTYNEIGTYVITAVITRGTDMTEYEQTYTLICDS